MKHFLSVSIRIISREDDSVEQLQSLIRCLLPNIKPELYSIQSDPFIDQFEHKRYFITFHTTNQKLVGVFTQTLFSNLSTDTLAVLASQVPSRVDEECFFYIRLDLSSLLANSFILTDAGDCFHITLSVASYPKKQIVAQQTVQTFLNTLLRKTH
jgi:RNA binding exosome subunit